MVVRLVSWSLTGTRRICRSSLMIEANILSNVVEQELQTRAVVFDKKKKTAQYSSGNRPASPEAIHLRQP